MNVPWVITGLILLLFYIQQNTPDPSKYCIPFISSNLWGSIQRDLVHGSAMQLIWVVLALYELIALENAIGSFWMLILVVWLMILSNIIQHYSHNIVDPIIEQNTRNKTLKDISDTIKKIEPLPCDLGFLGITLALEVVAIYFATTGKLNRSWSEIQWLGLQVIPALLFANVTVHGQVSGFAAGVLTVILLDAVGW